MVGGLPTLPVASGGERGGGEGKKGEERRERESVNEVGGGAAEDKDEIAHSLRLARLGSVKVPVFINRHFLTLCRYSFIKKNRHL